LLCARAGDPRRFLVEERLQALAHRVGQGAVAIRPRTRSVAASS
jgi:hypothetical protein